MATETSRPLNIKRVTREEVPVLCRFAEATFRVAWEHMNDPADFETYCRESFSLEHVEAEIAVPGAEFYLARFDQEPVAYLKLNVNCQPHDWTLGPALQLERIYVSAGVQSRGLGAALLQFSENRARETGAGWIWLSVWQKSPRSIAFYERHGYEICGVETFWIGSDAQDDWLMRKRIGG